MDHGCRVVPLPLSPRVYLDPGPREDVPIMEVEHLLPAVAFMEPSPGIEDPMSLICYPSGEIPAGDCDGSGSVSLGEVQRAANMYLGREGGACLVDANLDDLISIGEVQRTINAYLIGKRAHTKG